MQWQAAMGVTAWAFVTGPAAPRNGLQLLPCMCTKRSPSGWAFCWSCCGFPSGCLPFWPPQHPARASGQRWRKSSTAGCPCPCSRGKTRCVNERSAEDSSMHICCMRPTLRGGSSTPSQTLRRPRHAWRPGPWRPWPRCPAAASSGRRPAPQGLPPPSPPATQAWCAAQPAGARCQGPGELRAEWKKCSSAQGGRPAPSPRLRRTNRSPHQMSWTGCCTCSGQGGGVSARQSPQARSQVPSPPTPSPHPKHAPGCLPRHREGLLQIMLRGRRRHRKPLAKGLGLLYHRRR